MWSWAQWYGGFDNTGIGGGSYQKELGCVPDSPTSVIVDNRRDIHASRASSMVVRKRNGSLGRSENPAVWIHVVAV